MIESFEPSKDEEINKEIKIMGQEITDAARNMMIEIIGFIRKHQSECIESMPLGDFLEEINEVDSGFDQEIVKQINHWIESHPEDINLKKSVGMFLVSISNRVDAYEKNINLISSKN